MKKPPEPPAKSVAAIRTIPPSEADGELAKAYRRVAGRGEPAHVYQVQSLHPASMVDHGRLYRTLMFGESPLSRTRRELVATVVSHDNACHY